MSLWVDKHRPVNLTKLDYHKEQAEQLKNLVRAGDFPHLLVYGPNGAGKHTRVTCLLRELYGIGADKLRIEHHSVTTPSNKKIEIDTVASNYHIEINPSDAGIYDKIVVQEMIKTVAQTNQLDSVAQRGFKVLVLAEADRLSMDAQQALRRTMEKYSASCRLVLCAQSICRIIGPLRSRCLSVRVPSPTEAEISAILSSVCKKENINLPSALAQRIAAASDRNLRRALLMCEAARVQKYPFDEDQTLPNTDWEEYLRQTASLIVRQQSPKVLLEVRGRLYELLARCITPDIIIKGLVDELLASCDGSTKPFIVHMAAQFEARMHLGQKPIFHLEAFIASFMAAYKRFLDEGFSDLF